MELVYLWVEEYKNIKEQGFNFSPRFDCKYDKDSNELTIDEKKDYISIFPKNINVTAIVGENGSGKSSILEFINIISEYKNIRKKNYIFIFNYNKDLFYCNNNLIIKRINSIFELNNIYDFSNYFPRLSNTLINTYELDEQLFSENYFNLILKSNSNIIFNNIRLFDYCNVKFNKVEKMIFTINHAKFTSEYWIDLFKNYSEDIKFQALNVYNFLLNKIIMKFGNTEDFLTNFQQKIEINYLYNSSYSFIEKVERIKNYIQKFQENNFLIKFKSENEKKDFEIFFNFNFSNILNKLCLLKEKYKIEDINTLNNIIINDDFLFLLKKEKLIFFNFINLENNITFNDLSSGEQRLYSIFMSIQQKEYFNMYRDNIILLDEPDIFLHPSWQKNLLNNIIEYSKKYLDDMNLHFIVTTHSPFILSDLPKENVIFLEDGKQKKPFKEKEQTFGANIHTLLSHGFFMKDGLMGEFAKSKIEEIKKFYELVKRFEEEDFSSPNSKFNLKYIFLEQKVKFRHIQSIIGEPFLQTVIKNYLDELDIIFNGKKQFLQNEIKRLQELESSL